MEEVHDALHDAVPNAGVGGNNNGGNRGNGGDPRARVVETARRAARSAAAFDRALPRLDLRALRENRAEFAAAAGQLSAAAGYYARVAETAPPGTDAERRARRVLEDAYDKADDGVDGPAPRRVPPRRGRRPGPRRADRPAGVGAGRAGRAVRGRGPIRLPFPPLSPLWGEGPGVRGRSGRVDAPRRSGRPATRTAPERSASSALTPGPSP